MQKLILSGLITSEIDKGKDYIVKKDKVSYTITTTSNQKNNTNNNVTTINLGKCEDKLKEKYIIPKNDILYILKIDVLIDNIQKVEYEVYYPFTPNTLTKLDISICKDITIDISIPIDIPIDELDKYNTSSGLYNDLCYTLTSESGTDKTLKDRQNEYKTSNISVCEEGCDFSQYDSENKKAICSCFTKVKLPLISEIKVDKEKLFSNFKNIKNIGNFKMLKCNYLLYDIRNIFKNSANYMILILFILSTIALFSYICYNNSKIKQYIIQLSLIKEANKKDINKTTNNIQSNHKKNNNNKINNICNNKRKILSNNKNIKNKNLNKGKNNILSLKNNNNQYQKKIYQIN